MNATAATTAFMEIVLRNQEFYSADDQRTYQLESWQQGHYVVVCVVDDFGDPVLGLVLSMEWFVHLPTQDQLIDFFIEIVMPQLDRCLRDKRDAYLPYREELLCS